MPFTFISVYYKHGEWSAEHFDTLREGLLAECKYYFRNSPEEHLAWRKAPDDDLVNELLARGMYIYILKSLSRLPAETACLT